MYFICSVTNPIYIVGFQSTPGDPKTPLLYQSFESPPPPRSGESGDNHLIFTSSCFPGEHSLSLRSLIFRRLEVVRGREGADDFEPSET